MVDFDNKPVSLPHLRMVKDLAEKLSTFGENGQLPEKYHEAWSRHFNEHGITALEASRIGDWYVKHHTICPSIFDIRSALAWLREHKSLPNQRLVEATELLSGDLLRFLSERDVKPSQAVNALMQAAALVHLASYQNGAPAVGRAYIKIEFEGVSRVADLYADDILREVRQGVGMLADTEHYLYRD